MTREGIAKKEWVSEVFGTQIVKNFVGQNQHLNCDWETVIGSRPRSFHKILMDGSPQLT